MSWIFNKAEKQSNNQQPKNAYETFNATTATTTTTTNNRNEFSQKFNKRNSLGFFTLDSHSTKLNNKDDLLKYTSQASLTHVDQEVIRNFNNLNEYINKTPTSVESKKPRSIIQNETDLVNNSKLSVLFQK